MAKEVNIVVLCNEIFEGLEAKGCGMSPIKAAEGGYNGTFVNIVSKRDKHRKGTFYKEYNYLENY